MTRYEQEGRASPCHGQRQNLSAYAISAVEVPSRRQATVANLGGWMLEPQQDAGRHVVSVPGLTWRDEIGSIATEAFAYFQEALKERQILEEEQKSEVFTECSFKLSY